MAFSELGIGPWPQFESARTRATSPASGEELQAHGQASGDGNF